MHDIDRTQLETGWETEPIGEFGYEDYEFEMYPEFYEESFEEGFEEPMGEFETDSLIGEADEMELASQLLEITDEAELDQFIGDLFKKVSRVVGKALPPSVRRSLGGILKGVARRYLPVAGTAMGNLFAPGVGGVAGGKLASAAGRIFGLELEGLSAEDQEFEVARRYVRMATDAARRVASTPSTASPQTIAQRALAAAAQMHAPGLVATPGTPRAVQMQSVTDIPRAIRGKWVRRGRVILLLGD